MPSLAPIAAALPGEIDRGNIAALQVDSQIPVGTFFAR
jgi:hypothetical protein